MSRADEFIAEAARHIGYQETPENNTKFGAWIGANGEPWCAAFVSYCAFKAGVSIPPTPGALAMLQEFQERGRFSKYPVPGSIVFYAWDKSGDPLHVQHAGIVEVPDYVDDNVQAIEGNTSDMVARRWRAGIYVIGYGHWYTPSTLQKGGTGNLVRLVQKIVGVTMDAKFGPVTEAAVRAYQDKHGLVVDGIVGPRTWAKMLW